MKMKYLMEIIIIDLIIYISYYITERMSASLDDHIAILVEYVLKSEEHKEMDKNIQNFF